MDRRPQAAEPGSLALSNPALLQKTYSLNPQINVCLVSQEIIFFKIWLEIY